MLDFSFSSVRNVQCRGYLGVSRLHCTLHSGNYLRASPERVLHQEGGGLDVHDAVHAGIEEDPVEKESEFDLDADDRAGA